LRLGFDVVFVGEAENTFPAFAAAWLDNPKSAPPVVSATGPAFDLDQKIHADVRHGLFPFVEISRGCPHACKFCQVSSIFGRGMRHRSPQVVGEGIAQAVRAGFRRFRYLTPDAFAYRSGPGDTAQALEELLSCGARAGANEQMLGTFPSEVRPDRVTPALLQVVLDHCTNRTLVIGAQSGSDRVLELMNRGHTVAQARQAIFDIYQAGLKPHVDILFCFPGEQLQERRESLNLIHWCVEHARAKIHAHVYLPLPGTLAWPQSPCVLEEEIKLKLKELQIRGVLDGDWEHQAAQGQQILRWREEGKILAPKL
jgi:B12-binding domain/radical SAM domain protein